MKKLRLAGLALLPGLATCGLYAPAIAPRYTLGPAWQGFLGVWFYPAENFRLDQTGLAAIAGDGHPRLTADGELFDQTNVAAGLQTLQLPAVVRVTNLDNGRELVVRANDRGPGSPGRLIELTSRAAELLGVRAGDPVRAQVLEQPSRQLAGQLQSGKPTDQRMSPAPIGAVQVNDLSSPPGVAASPRERAATATAARAEDLPMGLPIPVRMPERIVQGTPYHGRLLIRAGDFGRLEFAERVQANLVGLPARIERSRIGRAETYRVAIGPFTSAAAADAALDQALKGGVTDARIVVE